MTLLLSLFSVVGLLVGICARLFVGGGAASAFENLVTIVHGGASPWQIC